MGLDWCLETRVRPGHSPEEVEAAKKALDDFYNLEDRGSRKDELEALKQKVRDVSIDPYETLGVPRIGIDAAATNYLIEKIIPSHREAIADRKKRMAAGEDCYLDEEYERFWTRPDKEITEDPVLHGSYLPEAIEYGKSTVTAYGPFRAISGYFSFRGKVIGGSPLLNDELREEAYHDMNPEQMLNYAARLEKCGIKTFRQRMENLHLPLGMMGIPSNVRDIHFRAKEVGERVSKKREIAVEKAGMKGSVDAMFRQFYEPSEDEELWEELDIVLDGAAWLRFWAEKGHAMWAWY